MDARAEEGMGYSRVRPTKLIDDTMGYSRLRSSKSTWFSYYQEENGEESGELRELPNEEGLYSGLEEAEYDFGDYTSPLTEESHLPLSPMEERKMSPCSEFEMDPGTFHTFLRYLYWNIFYV